MFRLYVAAFDLLFCFLLLLASFVCCLRLDGGGMVKRKKKHYRNSQNVIYKKGVNKKTLCNFHLLLLEDSLEVVPMYNIENRKRRYNLKMVSAILGMIRRSGKIMIDSSERARF